VLCCLRSRAFPRKNGAQASKPGVKVEVLMRFSNPLLLASFGVLFVAASCTLITDVDRSKIPDGVAGAPNTNNGGEPGNPQAGEANGGSGVMPTSGSGGGGTGGTSAMQTGGAGAGGMEAAGGAAGGASGAPAAADGGNGGVPAMNNAGAGGL